MKLIFIIPLMHTMVQHDNMFISITVLCCSIITGMAQFPQNGDPGAIIKMKNTIAGHEITRGRLKKLEAGLAERAIKRMKSSEKAKQIQEFIERGSLFLPGEGPTEENQKPSGKPLKFNENIGEQIIDPRTPTGFGNPFFRQLHVEQAVSVRKLLSETESKALRESGEPLQPVIRSGWTLIKGKGNMKGVVDYTPEFVMNLLSSPNMIIRRVCNSCHIPEFKEIYYKRLTDLVTRKSFLGMLNGPFDQTTKNECFVDFTLHSTYQDAIDGTNPWPYCGESQTGFPGNSGLTSSTQCMYEKQYCGGSDGQPDFAYEVETSSWIPIAGYGIFHIPGNRGGEVIEETGVLNAPNYLYESANKLIRMICYDCEDGYKDLFYKRITGIPDDIMYMLLHDFKQEKGNILNRDFKIFSSYEDALSDVNAWEICDKPDKKMAFPAMCRSTENAVGPTKFFRATASKLGNRFDGSTNRHLGVYVELDHLPETLEWMSESDEMKAFLHVDSTLEKDDEITCKPEVFDDTILHQENFFTGTTLEPYLLQGVSDNYAGWYDVQGCGKCNDWCGWFAPSGTTYSDVGNPYYKSWSDNDHVFACLTGNTDLSSNYLRVSGIDSTSATSVYSEFNNNIYTGWFKFIPTSLTKCGVENEAASSPLPYQYVGCYAGSINNLFPISGGSELSIQECYSTCRSFGKHFFGLNGPRSCWCGGDDENYEGFTVSGERLGLSNVCDCENSGFVTTDSNCIFQILYTPLITNSNTCSGLVEKVTDDFSQFDIPLSLNILSQVEDPFAGYYDVQRCGKCNDWCGWVGSNVEVSVSPPNPWFQTSTDTNYFACKLAGGYTSQFDMTEDGYFGESFPYQKCDGKGANTPAYRKETFIGCFKDSSSKSLLPLLIGNGSTIPFYNCADSCRHKGYHYFGRQNAGECRCGGISESDQVYAKEGRIWSVEANYCGDCLSDNIGSNKNCVFRIDDQYDPEVERKKHPCSHILVMDVRRYCYVSCRDKNKHLSFLAICNSLTASGLTYLNMEIGEWSDSPICDTKDCEKSNHPLGKDVGRSGGTF